LLAAALCLSACGGGTAAEPAAVAEDKVVHVYNWTDYIGKATIADFEAKTGIKVVYDTYDSNEVLETKMLTGRSGYDVVFPSGVPLSRQLSAGALQPLDKSKLPNLVHMDPGAMRRIAANDPGNRYAIPYMWGTVGLGYNVAMVWKALGTGTIDSLSAVFDPAVASRLAKCGIAILDAPEDVFMTARIYLGLDANSERREDLAAAERLLVAIRPYVRYFHSSQHVNDLASGEICVALSWNGLVLQARDRGAAASTPVQIAYALPREGSFIWMDTVAIPADAPHVDNAHAFLDFLMEPRVIARISQEIGYANGNAASREYLEEAFRRDPWVYPDTEAMQRLHTDTAESPDYMRDMNRAWTRIKTGQ
jgi:putrescine transport system substrate-binding protein